MKTILVATDYSAAADNAVEYSARLAKDTGAELLLFNVFKLSPHASNALPSTAAVDDLVAQSEDRLHDAARAVAGRHGIAVRWFLGKDDTVQSLSAYMKTHPVDLVAMGIESGLTEYKLFGNTTTDVIHLMQFPLLVVPNGLEYAGMDKVMYACEAAYLKPDCRMALLKELVGAFKAKLEVFHVHTHDHGQDAERAELEQKLGRILHDVEHRFAYAQATKVGEGIRAGLERSPADLLVMVPHRLGFIESITKGSQTSQMTVRARIPLLVIPNEVAC